MKVLNICNLKGGVGKTITAVNMACILGEVYGKRVLVIDNDKQGNTSRFFRRFDYEAPSIADVLTGKRTAEEVIKPTPYSNVHIIPANMNLLLANREIMLDMTRPQQSRLKDALTTILGTFDFCLIDNAPDENMSVINALVAGDDVLIPVKDDAFSFDGVREMVSCINQVRDNFNPKLKIAGWFKTMYRPYENQWDTTTNAMDLESCGLFGVPMLNPVVWSPKVSRTTYACVPMILSNPKSKVTGQYRNLVKDYLYLVQKSEKSESDK